MIEGKGCEICRPSKMTPNCKVHKRVRLMLRIHVTCYHHSHYPLQSSCRRGSVLLPHSSCPSCVRNGVALQHPDEVLRYIKEGRMLLIMRRSLLRSRCKSPSMQATIEQRTDLCEAWAEEPIEEETTCWVTAADALWSRRIVRVLCRCMDVQIKANQCEISMRASQKGMELERGGCQRTRRTFTESAFLALGRAQRDDTAAL